MAEPLEDLPPHARSEPTEHTRPATMPAATRVLLGLLAFLPLALAAGALGMRAVGSNVGPVLYGAMLLMFLLVLFFGAFAMNNRRLGGTGKVLWTLGFLLAGPIIIPLYWYIHVWHAPHRSFHS
ncbi:MAG: hypothetical protein ACOCXM_02745 [Myxococcota bacterium]